MDHGDGTADTAESSEHTPRQVYVCPAQRCRTYAPTCAQINSFFEACGKPKAVLSKWGEELSETDIIKEAGCAS